MARINADMLDLKEIIIRTNKVQKTHKGGRTLSWSVLVAVGDENGHVGIGQGKAAGIPDAIRKAIEDAKKNIIKIPLIDGTIPHEVFERFGASKVIMKPASQGTGVVAGGAVRPILELAGVTDAFAKILGSRNGVNVSKATMNCFKALSLAEEVCEARGMKLETLVPWYARKKRASEAEMQSDVNQIDILDEDDNLEVVDLVDEHPEQVSIDAEEEDNA